MVLGSHLLGSMNAKAVCMLNMSMVHWQTSKQSVHNEICSLHCKDWSSCSHGSAAP